MSLLACAILAAIITSAFLFVLASCRLSSIADDTAEQIVKQIAQGDGAVPPQVVTPFHSTGYDE